MNENYPVLEGWTDRQREGVQDILRMVDRYGMGPFALALGDPDKGEGTTIYVPDSPDIPPHALRFSKVDGNWTIDTQTPVKEIE